MPEQLPSPILPIDVAVVDGDLLWRAEVMNASRPLYADDFVGISEAAGYLHPSHPCVLVIGPNVLAETLGALRQARQVRPYLRVAVVGSALAQSESLTGQPSLIDSVLPAGCSTEELVEEVGRLHTDAVEQASADRDASTIGSLHDTRLIAITGAKAGEGATVTAVHLARTLQACGQQVTLVEIDPTFGDVAMRLGLHPEDRTAATRSLSLSSETIRHLVCDGPDGLKVFIPPHTKSAFKALPGSAIPMLLDELQSDADVLVVDSPFLQVHQSDLVALADRLIVVTTLGLTNLKNASVAGALLNRAKNVAAVLNRLGGGERRHFRHEEEPDERDVAHALQLPIVGRLPHTDDVSHVPDLRSDKDFLRAIDRLANEVTDT